MADSFRPLFVTPEQSQTKEGATLLKFCQGISNENQLTSETVNRVHKWLVANANCGIQAIGRLRSEVERLSADGKLSRSDKSVLFQLITSVTVSESPPMPSKHPLDEFNPSVLVPRSPWLKVELQQPKLPLEILLATLGIALMTTISHWASVMIIFAYCLLGLMAVLAIQNAKQNVAAQNDLAGGLNSAEAEIDLLRRDYQSLRDAYSKISPNERLTLAREIETQKSTLEVVGGIAELSSQRSVLEAKVAELQASLVQLDQEALLQSVGLYQPLYSGLESGSYKRMLEIVREKQKEMVKSKTAVIDLPPMNGRESLPSEADKNIKKMLIRAFNSECDACIDHVTFSNVDSIKKKIEKSFNDLNNLCAVGGAHLAQAYLQAKTEELLLCHEYNLKLNDEREEQRRLREEIREQAKVEKEIALAKEKIDKEEKHFNQIIAELKAKMASAAEDQKSQYENKLSEYEAQLAKVAEDKAQVLYREQSTRAGYVYIISNIGSFGEDVFKIGVTRGLVREFVLGGSACLG